LDKFDEEDNIGQNGSKEKRELMVELKKKIVIGMNVDQTKSKRKLSY